MKICPFSMSGDTPKQCNPNCELHQYESCLLLIALDYIARKSQDEQFDSENHVVKG